MRVFYHYCLEFYLFFMWNALHAPIVMFAKFQKYKFIILFDCRHMFVNVLTKVITLINKLHRFQSYAKYTVY